MEADGKASIHHQAITSSGSSISYSLIQQQLLGATEKRAAALSKTIMNDIERRLLQRQQAKPFETYLVAILLLACVERMCWYFKTWETNGNTTNSNTTATSNEGEQMASDDESTLLTLNEAVSSKWPLDRPPPHYSQQGERFSDILVMLLRMRNIPPKTTTRLSDGVIVLAGDDVDPVAREWFESVGISNDWLKERPSARYTGKTPEEWEGKYWSKVIHAGFT